jgi:hypothetical protein
MHNVSLMTDPRRRLALLSLRANSPIRMSKPFADPLPSPSAPDNVKTRRYIRGVVSVIGVDLLAGAAVGYLIRKARRVARRADGHVDDALDAGTDRVCELVEGVLGLDPVLTLLNEQSQAGIASDRTIRRAEDAIAARAEADSGFRQRLESLLTELERVPGELSCRRPSGLSPGGTSGSRHRAVAWQSARSAPST